MACHYCLNACVDDELTPQNDFSSFSIGVAEKGSVMFLTSGGGRPTVIELQRWNEEHQQNETVAFYRPKFCPECGRRLVENEGGK